MSTCFGSRSLKHRKKWGVFSVWNIETLVNCKSSTRLLRVSSRKMRLWRTWPQVLCYVTRFSTFLQFPGCPKTVLQAEQKLQSPQGSKWNQYDPMIHACLIRLGRPNSNCCCSTSCCCCKSGGPCSSNASLKCLMLPAATYKKPLRQTTILLLRQGFAMSCMKKLRKMGLEASTWVVQVLSKNIFSTPHFPSSDPKIKMIQPIYVTSIEISTFLSDPFNSCRSDLGHPAGPPIRGFCCSMVDGLKVWRTKKQIEKKDDTKNLLVKVGWCTYCHLISC